MACKKKPGASVVLLDWRGPVRASAGKPGARRRTTGLANLGVTAEVKTEKGTRIARYGFYKSMLYGSSAINGFGEP